MSEVNWDRVQTWRTYSQKHSCGVEVAHHATTMPDDWGGGEKQNWCVYALIAKGHPLFDEIQHAGELHKDKCIEAMPLHGGCTYHQWTHYVDWKGEMHITKKVGCDYQHYGDERFSVLTVEDMGTTGTVFHDAKTLLDYLCKVKESRK